MAVAGDAGPAEGDPGAEGADADVEVRAAGGLVWRVAEGRVEVLVVHRPGDGYDDWTFPKGKRDPEDRDDAHTATREVEEETGYRCVLGRELASTRYVDRRGRRKQVRYWEMTVVEGAFAPNDEVDAIRWVEVPVAGDLLTYPRDRSVLDAFATFAAGADAGVGESGPADTGVIEGSPPRHLPFT